jgi:hypothetical protein
MKRLVACLTAFTLLFGAAFAVSADDGVGEESTEAAAEAEEPDEEEGEAEEPDEPEAEPVPVLADFEDLSYTTRLFRPGTQISLGEFPVVADMDELNEQIETDLVRTFSRFEQAFRATLEMSGAGIDEYAVSFVVENFGPYATITIANASTLPSARFEAVLIYYVDKAAGEAMTEEEFEAALAAQEVPEEAEEEEAEEPAEEEPTDPVFVPLRATLEAAGFTLEWDGETQSIIVLENGESVASLSVGSANYVVRGEAVTLPAPALIDGTTQVPDSFFALLSPADEEETGEDDASEEEQSEEEQEEA